MARKGMMVGSGKKGYHNIIGKDPAVHSQSAKGIKQPQRVLFVHPYTNKKIDIKDVKVGMVFDSGTTTKDGVKNYMKVTERPFFHNKGDRPDIFYAIFVDPKDFSKKRRYDDKEFAIWDYEYKNRNMKRVK